MNLYDLTENWQRLDAMLEESAGDLTPEAEEIMATLVTEAPDALERAGFFLKNSEARVDVAKARRAALAATIEVEEAKQERVRAAMALVLQRLGKPVKLPEFTLSTQTRTSYAFALAPDADPLEIGDFLRYREPELDKKALTAAAKEGNVPAGILCQTSETTVLMLRTPAKKNTTENAA
jgi:hypothetical protein